MKKTKLLLYFFALTTLFSYAQKAAADKLLEQSITYHDPDNRWETFAGTLYITMKAPEKSSRESVVSFNLPKEYFKLSATRDATTVHQTMAQGKCNIEFVSLKKSDSTAMDKKKYTCERVHTMKDYYTYLYGLPMKLRDTGTNISPNVLTKNLKGKTYQVLKVTYDEEVGNDIWYFYFDPKTAALEAYQFFHDEAKDDGEYILLSGIENANGIKMPKTRVWYYNKDNVHLGTDELTLATPLMN